MTGKFVAINKISVKAENDNDKILIANYKDLAITKVLKIDEEASEDGYVVFELDGNKQSE